MTKFHKPEDIVFERGEVWYDSQDNKVIILGTSRYAEGTYDVNIYYKGAKEGQNWVHDKDAWNFQVRYTHSSERFK